MWRIAFDRETGVLWAGDVGQDMWEEIDIIERGGNYGWNLREGMHPFAPNGRSPAPNLIDPIWEYHHDVGKSITGGNVYRGKHVPELHGAYLYADFVSGQIWALWYDAEKKQVTANRTILPKGLPVMSFGEDDAGEVYFVTQDGGIYKFASPEDKRQSRLRTQRTDYLRLSDADSILSHAAKIRQERRRLLRQPRFEPLGAVAVAAGPRLGAVFVAAIGSRMGVLNLDQVEELFPVRPLFFQRHVAVTDFDPARRAVVEQAGILHVAQIFALGDRSGAQRAALDRLQRALALCPVSLVLAPDIA